MPNSNAQRASDMLRSQRGQAYNPPPSTIATAQALALVAIAEEMSKANDLAAAADA